MRLFMLLLFPWVVSSAVTAERITWQASGAVSGITGAGMEGLGLAVDAPVTVEFSYDDGAVATPVGGLIGVYETHDFRNAIALQMTIEIGDFTWEGSIEGATTGAPLTFQVTDVVAFFGVIEEISPTVSSKHGAVFGSFPAAGEGVVMELEVSILDEVTPFDFIQDLGIPIPSSVLLDEVTSANGQIRAGGERIDFILNPGSLVVEGELPGEPDSFDLHIARAGDEVTLSWAATVGKTYMVVGGNDLLDLQEVITFVADEDNESYAFTPDGLPEAQYYRVVRTD